MIRKYKSTDCRQAVFKFRNRRNGIITSTLLVLLVSSVFNFQNLRAQTCSVGSAVSSTGYGFIASGGSAHPTKATGTILASGSTLTPTNSAILQDATPLVIDMQRLVSEGSTFTFAVQRFLGSGNADATIEHSLNGTTWSTSGTGWGAASASAGIRTTSATSAYISRTVPTGGFRYVRITWTSAGNFLLIDGVRATHYCPVSVSSSRAIRSFYGPGNNVGSLASNVYPANAQALQFSTLTSPSNGTWTLNATTGAYTYSPNAGYDGFEVGVFRVCDGGADGNLATTGDNVCDQDTFILRAVFNCDTNVFYVPIPENNAFDHLKDIDVRTSGGNDLPLNVYMGLSVTSDAIVTYDHWEDGYETNPRSPSQSTTLIWGDGDLTNGIAPGTSDDILKGGTTSILQNNLLSVATSGATSLQSIVDYDGRDKIFIHGIGALSKLAWGNDLTLSVSGSAVPRTEFWGTDYTLPVGESTLNGGDMFEVTNIAIMASKNGTSVSIDYNNDGTNDVTTSLNEGEVYYADSRSGTTSLLTVEEGGSITATQPVQVMYMTGRQGTTVGTSLYGGRTFPLVPDAQLSTCYVVPAVYGISRRVFLFNPHPTNTITITRTGPGGNTSFNIGPNSGTSQAFAAGTTGGLTNGYQYCSGTTPFTMLACVDDDGIVSDWGFVPTSSSNLQQIILLSIGFGQDPTSASYKTSSSVNYEHLLVTPTTSTYFYVDLNGDKVPDDVSFNSDKDVTDNVTLDGVTYSESTSDNGILVGAYRTLSITSPTNDLSGAVVWTKTASGNAGNYGGLFSAVWGQNDNSAVADPNIDAGYNLPPKIFPPLNTNIRVRFSEVCPGSTTDSIHLNITGGVSPYKIQWINLTTGVNSVYNFTADSTKIGAITPGTYVIKLRDANCLSFQSTVTIVQKTLGCTVSLTGNVFDDGNGLIDSKVNSFGGGSLPSTPLYANLLNSTGTTVVATATVSGGVYTFPNVQILANYVVQLSTNQGVVGAAAPATALPTNWVNTGEFLGLPTVNGNDGSINSLLPVSVGTVNVTNANFGIDERPTSNNLNMSSQANPGIGNYVSVGGLTGADNEDGAKHGGNTIVISTLAVNGTLRYNGTPVTIGQVIPGYIPALLQVTPNFPGAGSVTFTYVFRDSAGFNDLSPATVVVPFTDPAIQISGTVFQDLNGTNDGFINGTPLPRPSSTQLYAYLVDSNNSVLDSQYILTNGTYTLTAPSSTPKLKVLLTTTQIGIGIIAPTNTLPANWVNVGDQWGTINPLGSGIEGNTLNANGSVQVTSVTSNITGINFGLEWAPEAFDKTYVVSPASITGITGNLPFSHFLYLNSTSGTSDIAVNNSSVGNMPGYLSGNDLEEGVFNGLTGSNPAGADDTLVITQLPDFNSTVLVYQPTAGNNILLVPNPTCPGNAACVYWDAVNSRYRIPNFDASKLLMMFKMNGQTSDQFKYAYIDAAGRIGRIATYTINYTVGLPVTISNLQCGNSTDGVGLTWNVANSVDMVSMDVMKSNGNGIYKSIHHMTDFVRTEWNQTYSYTDVNPGEGTLLYRIDGTDKDGKTEISDVCFTRIVNRIDKTVMDLAPNPTTGKTLLSIRSSDDAVYSIVMFDQAGRNIQNITATSNNGFVTQTLDLSSQSKGVYLVRVSWNGNAETFKVIKN